MKNLLLILLLLLFPACTESDAWMSPVMIGGGVPAAAGGDALMGKVTAESNTSTSYGTWCTQFTAEATFTATYGYAFLDDDGNTGNFKMAVYNTTGTLPDYTSQVGGCSSLSAIPLDPAWGEVTFDPGLSIVNTTVYWICYHSTADARFWYDAGTGAAKDIYTCPLDGAPSAQAWSLAMLVANYEYD